MIYIYLNLIKYSKINDIVVHPVSGEVYLSVTRGHGIEALPALLKIDSQNQI